jgi:putative ABC transport system ATP-binding protein
MLKMNHVSKAYRTQLLEIFALRDFSIHVREGEFIAVTGPSGGGKTTFLSIAGLLYAPTEGEYELDGVAVHGMSDQQRARLRSERVGFIFQSFNLIADLCIRDNVEMPLRYRQITASERRHRVDSSLSRVGILGRADHCPSELSRGELQRVGIARALVGSPLILLADEPTGNLDAESARTVMDLLQELHQDGATIIAVTHNVELAALAQREIHIFDGRIIEHPLLNP